jgi:hypothetical protein
MIYLMFTHAVAFILGGTIGFLIASALTHLTGKSSADR